MEKIKKSNLVDEVYSQLLTILASGEYPEGSKLPSEPQLSQALGVSRNTVRTAMSKLIALGIVENQQGYGNRVRSMNIGMYANSILPCMLANGQDLVAATEYRIGIESMAARLAAERATKEQIDHLYELCENAARYVNSDDDCFAKYDMVSQGGGRGIRQPAVHPDGRNDRDHVHDLADRVPAHTRGGQEP